MASRLSLLYLLLIDLDTPIPVRGLCLRLLLVLDPLAPSRDDAYVETDRAALTATPVMVRCVETRAGNQS